MVNENRKESDTYHFGPPIQNGIDVGKITSDGYEMRRERRRAQVDEILRMGVNKEPFDAKLVIKVCWGIEGKKLDHVMEDKDLIEDLRQMYYLDKPEFNTNNEFMRWYDESD